MMKRMPLVAVMLLLASCAVFDTQSKVAIAKDGRAVMDIVVPADPTPAEKTACKDLGDYLKKVTGADFVVVAESEFKGGKPAIYLGQTAFAKRNGVDFSKLGDEEWVVRSAGADLILSGGRPRGTLYAVYEFLESHVGCHWLAWDAEIVPAKPDLMVTAVDQRGKPVFEYRDLYTTFGNWQSAARKSKIEQFRLRNRQQSVWNRDIGGYMPLPMKTCHTFYLYVPPAEWFETHPEYFSMDAKGKRTAGNYQHVGGAGSQLCLSNPDVARITAENMSKAIKAKEKEFADQGNPRKFRVCELTQEDNASFICQCPECKKISERDGSESGLLIQYVNKVADLLSQEYPDIKIRTFAYVSTDKPPLTVKPRDNVIVQLCDLYGKSDCYRPLTHSVNQPQGELIRGWAKIAKELHLWDYWDMGSAASAPGMPIMIPAATIAADMRFFRDHRVTGMFIEDEAGITQQSFYDLGVWAGMQLLDNPDLPSDQLAATFIDGYYGPAAIAMRAYYDFLAAAIEKEPTPLFRPVIDSRIGLTFMNRDYLVRCRELLMNAEAAAAPGSPEQLRVWREMIVVYKCMLHYWPWFTRQTGREFPFPREEILSRYEAMRQAVVNYQYDEKRQKELFDDLRREMTVYRTVIPLPEQFQNLPADKVMDFTWPKFAPWDVRDDPEAAGGRAIAYDKADLAKGAAPVAVGLYDRFGKKGGPGITIADIPKDEKYHLYKIGQFSLGPDTVAWIHGRWLLTVPLKEAFLQLDGAVGADPNLWEAHVSIKLTGPAYVPGSTKPNAVWVDRVVLVKPEAK